MPGLSNEVDDKIIKILQRFEIWISTDCTATETNYDVVYQNSPINLLDINYI